MLMCDKAGMWYLFLYLCCWVFFFSFFSLSFKGKISCPCSDLLQLAHVGIKGKVWNVCVRRAGMREQRVRCANKIVVEVELPYTCLQRHFAANKVLWILHINAYLHVANNPDIVVRFYDRWISVRIRNYKLSSLKYPFVTMMCGTSHT